MSDDDNIIMRKNGMPLASSVVVDDRINQIVDLYIQGVTRLRDIRKYAEQQGWGVKDRAIEKYMARARKILQSSTEIEREGEIGKALARYELIFYKSFAAKNYKVALAAQKSICDLFGLNAPTKTAITDTDGNNIPSAVTIEIIETTK